MAQLGELPEVKILHFDSDLSVRNDVLSLHFSPILVQLQGEDKC